MIFNVVEVTPEDESLVTIQATTQFQVTIAPALFISGGGGGESTGNIDGGSPASIYGGTTPIDGGSP